MTRRRVVTLVALAIFIGLSIAAGTIKGQPSASGDYGAAFFYRSDIYSRDGIVDEFRLDPGAQGCVWQNSSFEEWDGTHGACTDCPTDSIVCLCTPPGDIESNTTHYYDYNTSLRMNTEGLFDAVFYVLNTWAAETCYQISFWYKGEVGTEDLNLVVGNTTVTDTYNFATDTFTAPLTTTVYLNIGTTWTEGNLYVVGAAGKTVPDYGIGFFTANTDGDYIYLDNVQVRELNSCSVVGSRGNVLSVPLASDPLWAQSEVMLPRTGTGPAYKTGMQLDGVDDFLSCADGDCVMDPVNWNGGGKFSVACRIMTNTVAAGNDYLISKWTEAGNQRSWMLLRGANHFYYYVSDDGTNEDFNLVAGLFVQDALYSFVSTFDPSGGSGACVNNIYYNAYQVDTDATMTECVPFDSTAGLLIGAWNAGANYWDGSLLECTLWEKDLSAIEANKYINPHFPNTNYGDGFYVDTCSQAASHATCSSQICRDGTPNTCQAEGTGVMACYGQYTELLDNNSFESYVGDPSDGEFDDWNEGGLVTAYLAHPKHGNASARLKGSSASMTSECLTNGIGNDVYIELSALALIEGDVEVWVREYDTGFCSNQVAITYPFFTCTPGSVYGSCGEVFTAATWNVATSSYAIQIISRTTGCDILVDNVSVKEASYHTPWVHNPSGAGTTTYNSRQYELHNPLSDYCESEADDCYLSGFCASGWVYTDWSTDGVTHFISNLPGTAGNNNRWYISKTNTEILRFYLYDNAGVLLGLYLTNTATNWSVGNWKYVEVCSSNTGTIVAHHYNVNNSTWYDWVLTTGAGTGIQADQSTDLHIGHSTNTGYLDGYIPEIHISPYDVIYPQKGFNGGRPPQNDGAPY